MSSQKQRAQIQEIEYWIVTDIGLLISESW